MNKNHHRRNTNVRISSDIKITILTIVLKMLEKSRIYRPKVNIEKKTIMSEIKNTIE